jgi:DNA-binding transcriptional regulator YdaS (Cro superfamily)
MDKPRTPIEAVDAVIALAFGGVATRLAKHFDVSDQTVVWWRRGERDGPVPFPAEHCPACERLTSGRVRCEELRPDVAWDVLRLQAGEPDIAAAA